MTYPRELEYFITIVREGNLSRASEKLCITQPALSKFLSKIESDVGVKLISRNTVNVELTPAGEIYYKAALNAFDVLNTASRKIEDLKENGPTKLTVGIPSFRMQSIIANFTSPLLWKYKNLSFSVVEASLPELKKKLIHNEIDLAIMGYTEEDPELSCVPLYTTELQLAVYKNHFLAKQNIDCIDIHDITEEKFVIPSKNHLWRVLIDRYCEEQNVTIHPVIETEGKNAALLYIKAEAGIGFFQKDYGIKIDGIKYIDLKHPCYHRVGIFHKNGEFINSVENEFTKLAVDYFKNALQN